MFHPLTQKFYGDILKEKRESLIIGLITFILGGIRGCEEFSWVHQDSQMTTLY